MKLDYFSLLSPEPIYLENIGSIISPTLRDISKLKYCYNTYQTYISTLLMDIKTYYETIDKFNDLYFADYTEFQKNNVLQIRKEYESMSDEEKNLVSFYNILIFDEPFRNTVVEALNFFILENVAYSEQYNSFLVYKSDMSKPIGLITQKNYSLIVDIILQRIAVEKQQEENVKVKNKTAAKLLEKIKNANKKKQQKHDKKMELPNLVSALVSHSKNLNILNIWDLTIYQLYDQFRRQQLDDYYDINSSHVAAWGDSDNKFDNTIWYSLIHEN